MFWDLVSSLEWGQLGIGSVDTHLDFTEILPATSPRSWKYRDGTKVWWTNFAPGEPNPSEHYISLAKGASNEPYWNGNTDRFYRQSVCSYYVKNPKAKIPAAARCFWLLDLID